MRHNAIISIENLIGQANHMKAVDYLMRTTANLIDNQEMYNELIKLKARLAQIQNEKTDGYLTDEIYRAEITRVIDSIIEFKDKVEKALSQLPQQEGLKNAEIELLIHTNAYAQTVEDIDIVKKTLHPKLIEEAIPRFISMFEQIDAKYEIKSIEITSLDEQFATATVTQIAHPLGENAYFLTYVSTFIYTLEKVEGRWKFFEQILKKMELLNSI